MTPTDTDSTDEDEYAGEFRSKRMENAHYWAAQAHDFMAEQVIGLQGEWYVEIIGGKPIIVMSDAFPEGGIDALETELRDYNFPTDYTRRELADETRIFFNTPTDDRLVIHIGPAAAAWREGFENGSYGPEGEEGA